MFRLVRLARCSNVLQRVTVTRNFKVAHSPILPIYITRAFSTNKTDTETNTVTITESDIQSQHNIVNKSDEATQLIPDILDTADQFLADSNFKAAAEKYTEVLKNHKQILPEGVPVEEIYSRRAQCYHKLRKFTEARDDCKKILDNSDIKYFTAEAHRRLGDMIIDEDAFSPSSDPVSKVDAAYRAIAHYNKSINLQIEEDTFCSLGSALLTVKEYKTAERAFTDALRINPDLTPALQGKGDAFIGQGFWGKAKECYEEFLRLEEEYYASFSPSELIDVNVKSMICQAHFQLARINMELMEPEDVRKHCETLLELNHLFIAQANSFIARSFFIEGKYEQLGLTSEAEQDENTHQFLSSKKQSEVFHLENKLRIQLQKLAEENEHENMQQSEKGNKK